MTKMAAGKQLPHTPPEAPNRGSAQDTDTSRPADAPSRIESDLKWWWRLGKRRTAAGHPRKTNPASANSRMTESGRPTSQRRDGSGHWTVAASHSPEPPNRGTPNRTQARNGILLPPVALEVAPHTAVAAGRKPLGSWQRGGSLANARYHGWRSQLVGIVYRRPDGATIVEQGRSLTTIGCYMLY